MCSQFLLVYAAYSQWTRWGLDWMQLAWESPYARCHFRKDRGKDTEVLISP
jgi:hypothetical protein